MRDKSGKYWLVARLLIIASPPSASMSVPPCAWLGPDMINAYTELHRQGFAASVEVWEGSRLVGGLYGVTIGKAFFGESMFSLVPSASKMALILLAQFMEEHGGTIIDCQLETPHLRSMGGRYILYDDYLKIIRDEGE